MLLSEWVAWLSAAPPGATAVYHRGRLDTERLYNPALDTLAATVWHDAQTLGLAELSQRRYGADEYEYRATRTTELLP
jgi:hypothetical protein